MTAVIAFTTTSICVAVLIAWLLISSGTNMHNKVVWRVLRAKILFFDSNPIGRIVTRFSKDIMVIDFVLGPFVYFVSQGLFRSFFVAVTVVLINPWILIPTAFCVFVMVMTLREG